MQGPDGSNGRRPTIRDVAERAGVSKSLVSLVMRGEPMVREEKRQRGRQAGGKLGDLAERAGQVFEEAGLSTVLITAAVPGQPISRPLIDGRAIGALKDLHV